MREENLSINNNYHEGRTLVLIIIIIREENLSIIKIITREENLSINNNYHERGEP